MQARPTHLDRNRLARIALVSLAASTGIACGGGAAEGNGSGHGQPGSRGGRPGGGDRPAAAVPVEVQPVERRTIASYLETNGAIEAENDVDIVARAAGPIVELAAEEGMFVKKGQLLARIDETELRAQVEIARVKVRDAERNHARAHLVPREPADQRRGLRADRLRSRVGRGRAGRAQHPARLHQDRRAVLGLHRGAGRAPRREHHGQPASLPHLRLRSAAVPHSGAGEGAVAAAPPSARLPDGGSVAPGALRRQDPPHQPRRRAGQRDDPGDPSRSRAGASCGPACSPTCSSRSTGARTPW